MKKWEVETQAIRDQKIREEAQVALQSPSPITFYVSLWRPVVCMAAVYNSVVHNFDT